MAAGLSAEAGIAVFVKTPGLSPVKTRLAAAIGAQAALAVYRGCIECVAECVEAAVARSSLHPYWAVAEADGAAHWSGWPVLIQPPGDLGARMAGIHAQLRARHRCALLLGADAPALEPGLLIEACAALAAGPARAIAPAQDGGFLLFGSNADHRQDDWSAVAYGAADTGARFLATVGAGLPLRTLAIQQDLDTLADARALAKLLAHSPAQRRLRERLAALS